jgi:prepilin-type N-terminal cleavage/methylation domain-containing protein
MTTPSSARRPTDRTARRRGLTLVELLVALVLLGLVMTLVSQAMFQAARIARAADESTRTLGQRWSGGYGLSPVLANLVAPQEQKEPWFEGQAQRITGWSSAPISGADTGVERFEVSIRQDPDDGERSQLVNRPAGFGARLDVVAVFAARAEFAFVDRNGRSHPVWPPLATAGVARDATAADAEQLPRAVVVRDSRSGDELLRYPFQGETSRPLGPTKPFWEMQ